MNTTVQPPSAGGSPSGLPGDRVMRGTIARWSNSTGWVDRDGLPLPDTMLVIGFITVLRRWKDNRPEYKAEHPLPDLEQLNAAIPVSEWEPGKDGKPRKPWALTYVVYMVELKTGALYTYAHDTYGAMLAFTALEEQIADLCGVEVLPDSRHKRVLHCCCDAEIILRKNLGQSET